MKMNRKSLEKSPGTFKKIDHLSENLDLTENERLALELEWILNNIQTHPKEVMDLVRAHTNTKVCSEAHKQHTGEHEKCRRGLRRHRRTN
ncbi:hypothetical protein C5167_001383 [Papaver somniferum]|uniref:Uncharacterized protein n=1 Tax=Papaver somniferum TaxID=3469 RepID=A0A4Y7KWU9_PAPSO|nr:hypothetical protein C5167_001383 [Papaver somniferum]